MTTKRILVTGAAGGLGQALCAQFAEFGAQLILTDLASDRLTKLASELDVPAVEHALGCQQDAQQIIESAKSHGPVDAVVHLVGGFVMGPYQDATESDFEQQLLLNVKTLHWMLGQTLRDTTASHFVGIAAGPGFEPRAYPEMALYAATKSAATALMRSVGAEMQQDGRQLTIVYPMGAINTPGNRQAMPDVDPATWIQPMAIAQAIWTALTMSGANLNEIPVYPPV